MRPITFTLPALAIADVDSIVLSQALAAPGALTINGALATGGVATLTNYLNRPRYGLLVTIKSAGDDHLVNFTITGTAPGGAAQTEIVAGTNASTATSTKAFETVTGVSADAAVASTVEVGTAAASQTAAMPLDIYTPNQAQVIETDVTGTINYTWQYTADDPFDPLVPPRWFDHPTAAMVAASTDQISSTTTIMRAVRFNVASGTGTARNTIVQQSTA